MAQHDAVDEFKQEMRNLIGPVLRKRERGRSVNGTCDQIAEELIEFIVGVRDGTLAEAAGVVEESRTLTEASIRINHRRSNR